MVGGGLGAGEVIHVVTVGEGDTLRISKVFTVLAMAADALIASSCKVIALKYGVLSPPGW